ncbi:hypothetical protein ACRU44_12675 [Mycobacterium colombiense]
MSGRSAAQRVPGTGLSNRQAMPLTQSIRNALQRLNVLILKAWQGQADKVPGYESWDAYCDAEFSSSLIRLPLETRTETVKSLFERGMSTRAIGAAVGVSDSTVRQDTKKSGARNHAPERVTGRDGKSYATTRERKPKAKPQELTAGPRKQAARGPSTERGPRHRGQITDPTGR